MPEIQPDERREIRLSFQWRGYVRHLLENKEVEFRFAALETSQPGTPAQLDIGLVFCPDIGTFNCDIRCPNSEDSEVINGVIDTKGAAQYIYKSPKAPIAGESEYVFVCGRR